MTTPTETELQQLYQKHKAKQKMPRSLQHKLIEKIKDKQPSPWQSTFSWQGFAYTAGLFGLVIGLSLWHKTPQPEFAGIQPKATEIAILPPLTEATIPEHPKLNVVALNQALRQRLEQTRQQLLNSRQQQAIAKQTHQFVRYAKLQKQGNQLQLVYCMQEISALQQAWAPSTRSVDDMLAKLQLGSSVEVLTNQDNQVIGIRPAQTPASCEV